MANINDNEYNEITLKQLILKINIWVDFLLSKLKIIIFIGLLGGGFGLVYAMYKPVTYTAKISFILEENKNGSSGLSGLASLAGQFGMDIGGSNGGGILSGDNILLYFKSPALAREVLLTPFDSTNQESIADVYIRVYKLNVLWEKNKRIGKIKFAPSNSHLKFTRVQDSLIQEISENIVAKQFNVLRPDKKASFIDVYVTMENELLSKLYCERIVQRVVDRYINTKTQRQKSTVDKLQTRVDSISFLLNQKTISGASLQNSASTMDINPLYRTNTSVAVETTIRDKALLSTIFASVTQNLEMAKFTLSQETPVIQIIDSPIMPLKVQKISKLKTPLLFFFLFSFVSVLFFVFKRLYNQMMGEKV